MDSDSNLLSNTELKDILENISELQYTKKILKKIINGDYLNHNSQYGLNLLDTKIYSKK